MPSIPPQQAVWHGARVARPLRDEVRSIHGWSDKSVPMVSDKCVGTQSEKKVVKTPIMSSPATTYSSSALERCDRRRP